MQQEEESSLLPSHTHTHHTVQTSKGSHHILLGTQGPSCLLGDHTMWRTNILLDTLAFHFSGCFRCGKEVVCIFHILYTHQGFVWKVSSKSKIWTPLPTHTNFLIHNNWICTTFLGALHLYTQMKTLLCWMFVSKAYYNWSVPKADFRFTELCSRQYEKAQLIGFKFVKCTFLKV